MSETLVGRLRRHHGSHWGAFTAVVEEGRLVGVEPFAKDPAPSPLLGGLIDAVYAENRVRRPAIRKGWLEDGPGGRRERRGAEAFVPVSWDQALDLVAGELTRVRREHGNRAIFAGSYGWASAGKLHHPRTVQARFLNTIGGFVGQVHTYSMATAQALLPFILGSAQAAVGPVTGWDSIAQHCDLLVAFGGLPLRNDQVTTGGSGEHLGELWLRRALAGGMWVVNISPCRDDMPDFAQAEHLAPRPHSDSALMLGLAHTLAVEGRHDRAFLDRYCVGYPRFEAYLLGTSDGQPKDADWAAALCGIEAERIRALARRMAAGRTMLTATLALQRAEHGEQPFWMLITLAAMLGQIGLPGGGFGFGYSCVGGTGHPRTELRAPQLPTGANPVGDDIPVARIADMLLQPGEAYEFEGRQRAYPDIRLVYWCGGNPFHHHQDLNRLLRAWQRPETVIVHEPWWTATARHADIVLPATTTLERNDIGAGARDRFWLAMQQAIAPQGEARSDFDIFAGLARRLGTAETFTEGRSEMGWLRHLYDVARQQAAERRIVLPDFDGFWAAGHVEIAPPEQPYVQFGEFRADPVRHPLKTPSGRIEIFCETIARLGYADCPGHPRWLPPSEWLGAPAARRYPLHLLSSQPAARLHGQLDHTGISRAAKLRGRERILLSPQDAVARGIGEGDIVRVFNARGALLAAASVTDAMRPGVVQLPTGAWYDPAEPGQVGSLDKHGNPNMLTLDRGTSRLTQGPSAQTALVEVERHDGALPEVSAHSVPAGA
ncbi:MAG: molybdopterin guanine dinucleotide-containing S/N-oxide reductase [Alphaproteobacteria bacterium]|nr:molybdopterin guanine dinucleotide-containing S/N-oxide reductase [Alphaproteobacteria bacterium]